MGKTLEWLAPALRPSVPGLGLFLSLVPLLFVFSFVLNKNEPSLTILVVRQNDKGVLGAFTPHKKPFQIIHKDYLENKLSVQSRLQNTTFLTTWSVALMLQIAATMVVIVLTVATITRHRPKPGYGARRWIKLVIASVFPLVLITIIIGLAGGPLHRFRTEGITSQLIGSIRESEGLGDNVELVTSIGNT